MTNAYQLPSQPGGRRMSARTTGHKAVGRLNRPEMRRDGDWDGRGVSRRCRVRLRAHAG